MMPLSMVNTGRRVRLLTVKAGRGLQARLAAMGLVPGVELEVIRNSHHGPFIVSVKDTRLVLGRGMAHKIEVE
ncbi:MAG: ferrous iron transport protein A [candidate division Zixibacteria bacterium]|nr:ferrous iron transport protein A [candidate division Zixibacteria bacterium]